MGVGRDIPAWRGSRFGHVQGLPGLGCGRTPTRRWRPCSECATPGCGMGSSWRESRTAFSCTTAVVLSAFSMRSSRLKCANERPECSSSTSRRPSRTQGRQTATGGSANLVRNVRKLLKIGLDLLTGVFVEPAMSVPAHRKAVDLCVAPGLALGRRQGGREGRRTVNEVVPLAHRVRPDGARTAGRGTGRPGGSAGREAALCPRPGLGVAVRVRGRRWPQGTAAGETRAAAGRTRGVPGPGLAVGWPPTAPR